MTEIGEPLKWGIIGLGFISRDFVLALNFCQRPHKVVALAASNSVERSLKFRSEVGLDDSVKAYADYDSLIRDPDVEIVYVGNLNGSHFEWTMKALDAGKGVLCEKPIALNSTQASLMCQKARSTNQFLMEAFWSRFFPAWKELRRSIESKELGEPRIAEANMCFNLPSKRRDLSTGECPLLDIGLYSVMFATYVFSGRKVAKVSAAGQKDTNGCDVWANITLEFEGDGHAKCYYNSKYVSSCSASVTFERGQFVIPDKCWCPNKLIKSATPGSTAGCSEMTFQLPDEMFEKKLSTSLHFINSSGLSYEADHVFDCIRNGKTESEIMSLDESLKITKVLDEVRRQLSIAFFEDA